MALATPLAHLRLMFDDADFRKKNRELGASLSAIAAVGDTLWLAGDESAELHTVRNRVGGNFDRQKVYSLAELFPALPSRDEEADIEGLAVDGGRLWVLGSHSQRRGLPKPGASAADAAAALAIKPPQVNRFLLGAVRLKTEPDKRCKPEDKSGLCLPFPDAAGAGNPLMEALAEDKVLAPFLTIPSKDNGLDIEGLAVRGGRMFLGLRGPVLRGWAVILEVRPVDGEDELNLEPFPDGALYRRHLLDLGGLGVRDLEFQGGDLLILAGPSMALDGPVRLFRWRGCLEQDAVQCLDGLPLEWCLDLPYGHRSEHAEGMCLYTPPGQAEPLLLVVYDTPAAGRFHDGRYYEADLFRL